MISQKNNLFRKESLERLSSPEQLNQLMQVVSLQEWIPLVTTASLLVLVLIWSVFGRIPITVVGRGVLIQPSRIIDFQSPITGQLQSLNVEAGQCVRKNQVLATIDPADTRQKLQQQRTKLAALNTQNQELSSLQEQQTSQEKQSLRQQSRVIQQRLEDAQALADDFKNREVRAIAAKRSSLQETLQDDSKLAQVLKQRFENRQQLKKVGAISGDQVLDAEQSYRETLSQISDLQAQLQELNIRSLQSEKTYRETLSQIADYQAQLQELKSKEKSTEQQSIEATNTQKNQILEVKQNIQQLELELQQNSQITSKQDGCILELTASPGQIVSPGTRLGSIRLASSSNQLVAVTYFALSDGKKIRPGMDVQMTPDTVKREQFGGILGTISNVSTFPVTKQGATHLIGNAEVVESLMPKGGAIAVFSALKPSNTTSGYQWTTSKGPQLQTTPGTTITASVTIDKQAPITFFLPVLRAVSGGSI